ncbi:MAG: efflux RND transporter periplasmic adaptor subunit [Sandaracinus sp.]|nr:efflux RND transporter periplasmic adaptor subunit [Myxococcales bacterium]MCB9615505.1 efflux RND transporter periplasmic adaptor subunit [Sandaracinus sp.]MCB9634480.1 efflux RND transporter periplasmic adaptor subunit [Sandaracinus sp.]
MPRVLALLFLVACAPEEAAPEPAPRLVRVEVAARGPAVDRVVLLGDVEGELDVRVVAELPERIRELHVAEGDAVTEGAPIATLEAATTSADVAQADAALSAAEAARDQLRVDLARVAPLVERSALPRSQRESLEAQLRSADAQVAQLRASRQAASLRRGRTVVRAPASGIVAELGVDPGDLVSPQVPLARVVRMDRVKVVLRVVEQDFVRLAAGMQVVVRPTALPDVTRSGTLARKSPVLDRLSRTGVVEIDVDNPDHVLRPGMVAEVAIELERRENVVLVPSRAVLMSTRTARERVAHVYVEEDGRVVRREVALGRRYPSENDESRVEIVRGLEGGEAVVVEGHHVLRDGARVRVAEAREVERDEASDEGAESG